MALSAFDLYSVGIGPSSSHPVGPLGSANIFAARLAEADLLAGVARVRAELFGSLGATGHGHGSPKAVVLGLEGEDPATVDTDLADLRLARLRAERGLRPGGRPVLHVVAAGAVRPPAPSAGDGLEARPLSQRSAVPRSHR